MPTEDLGHIHHSGNGLGFPRVSRFVSIQIIAPLRWAVERLAEWSADFVMASRRGLDARRALRAAA